MVSLALESLTLSRSDGITEMKQIAKISVGLSLVVTLSTVVFAGTASASTWSSWTTRCKPVLANTWVLDYTRLYNALTANNKGASLNAANALGLLSVKELACDNSPDPKLNQQIESLTYLQTVAMLTVKSALAGKSSNVAAGSAVNQMYAKEATLLRTLAKDVNLHG